LYGLPNFLHFAQRLIWISPQLGHRNFVASPPGAIGLPQLVHVVNVNVAGFSVMMDFLNVKLVIVMLPYKSFEIQLNGSTILSSRPTSHIIVLMHAAVCSFILSAQDYYCVPTLLADGVCFGR
jgi:hypothetical protein